MLDFWESIMPRYRFPASTPSAPAAVAGPSGNQPASFASALETQFPHILSAIQALWGFKELNTYFTKLTIDERGGRAGFPPEVWDEIHTLLRLHQEILPEPLFATNISRHALDFMRSN
ncbi:hypothetical protein [Janthinobacterium sp. 17J80-10]|uniref:hypothetical protein n=1 Tax=Janthinobacterium sp. 17J80-10 TaxID=2497863 RepID=UPI00100562C8|nr:hypothetical protein [Janthinobacterium sp. 17J80-10]QAU35293.1 hypothetical protein EKL02_14530 [Janthinobacterium sp. 17J80-10]